MIRTILCAALVTVMPIVAKAEEPLAEWQQKALELIQSEQQVNDARWRSPESNVLWVEMTNDGSKRDGFAQYLCMVLTDADAPQDVLKTIWIYDAEGYSTGQTAMGMAACR